MTEHILKKIDELFINTPEDVGVGFGYKRVDNQFTDEKVIVFNVVKKLPLSELAEEDVLPSTVEINGVIYNTDVVQTGGIQLLACDNSSSNPCFSYGYPPDVALTPNSQQQRPLKGGSTISEVNGGTGTMGFIAKHTRTGKLVGVTNSHVMFRTFFNFLTLQYSPYGIQNIEGNTSTIAQGYNTSPKNLINRGKIIGKSLFVTRWNRVPLFNYSDSGIFSLIQKDFSGVDLVTTESWKQVGLDIGTTPPPFATTAELDNLLTGPLLEIASSGARTGPKQGTCGLRISQINVSIGLGESTLFKEVIEFTRVNPDCLWPAGPGDSGSAIFAKIGGVWKIIGLVFAGSHDYTSAYACRIDKVAEDLGIEAWDGTVTSTSFVNPNSIKVDVTKGASGDYSRTGLDGKFYQQGSVTNYAPGDYPCYKYIIEIYTNGCNLPPGFTLTVYSEIPAQVGKWYPYTDPTYGTTPCKVITTTNDLGYYNATSTFRKAFSNICVL